MKLFCILLVIISVSQFAAYAQDEARAAWQVASFDITVNNPGSDRALHARAAVSVRNIGRAAGSTLTLRINSKAEIKNINVANAVATFRTMAEPRGNAQRITISLPTAVAPNDLVAVTVDYVLPLAENSGISSLSAVGSQFLPLSLWFPAPNTPFASRGPDSAPFRVTVTGAESVSSGAEKSSGGNSVFEQSLNGQPFFVTGAWDRVNGAGNSQNISAFVIKGTDAAERTQAANLIALAANAKSFFSALFGNAPDIPVRLVEVTRGGGFDDGGTVLLGTGAFGRKKIDTATAVSIAEGVARLWLGGATPIRGEGHGVLRDGLVRFFATLFLEKQFGADVADAERGRERLAYAAIARRDAPLSLTTPVDSSYFSSVTNKGAMVWRLVDHVIGRESFIAATRELLAMGKTDPEGMSLARARIIFAAKGPETLKALLDQELDQPTDMNLMAGLPRNESGQWLAALRNLGSIEATVNVAGAVAGGQTVVTSATIPAHDFGQAVFKTSAAVVRVEVDPEKFYPQLDYSDDVAPRAVDAGASLAEATRLFGAQEFAKSEKLARDLLTAFARMNEARIVLARSLLAQNRIDEAEREFKKLADDPLPTPAALAWSSIGMGEITLQRGQTGDAVKYFTEAIRADAEYASTLAARAGRIRAEGTAAPVDESARAFVNQLDAAIRSGRQAETEALIVPGELQRFVRGVVGTQPEQWQTRVLRTEPLDANHLAADVQLSTKQLGVEHSGTAVFVLVRIGGSWKLSAIEFFEVR